MLEGDAVLDNVCDKHSVHVWYPKVLFALKVIFIIPL